MKSHIGKKNKREKCIKVQKLRMIESFLLVLLKVVSMNGPIYFYYQKCHYSRQHFPQLCPTLVCETN